MTDITQNKEDFFVCCGVLGRPAIHSRSPQLFHAFFRQENIHARYLRLAANEVDEVHSIEEIVPIRFLNITSPFKYEVDAFAGKKKQDGTHPKNVLWKTNDQWDTINTDTAGILGSLGVYLEKGNPNMLIIGSGGAAEAAIRALTGKKLTLCARNTEKVNELAAEYSSLAIHPWEKLQKSIEKADIIIYTIPGHAARDLGIHFPAGMVVLDANYHDSLKAAGALDEKATYLDGWHWLIHQGIPVMKKWVPGCEPDVGMLRKELADNHLERLNKIVLVGLPGAGKSVVGKKLAEKLDYIFIDLDRVIEEISGQSIPVLFREKGEPYFRDLESKALANALQKDRIVLASGGGVIQTEKNRNLLSDHAFPVWLMVRPDIAAGRLDNEERPLFDDGNMKAIMDRLHRDRLRWYATVSELCIDVSKRTIDQTVNRLYEAYHSAR